jgi:secreted PhoX family phosphatase
MEPTSVPDAPDLATSEAPGEDGHTRRNFIRGIAAAGASTAAVTALDRAGVLDLATAQAQSAAPNAFSDFRAIAPSGADVVQVPEGYRADVIIGYGDAFANEDGTQLLYGYNNDYLAYFPLKGSDEGLVFVNHEYPGPYLQHGQKDATLKTRAQVELERESVGNSIVHLRRDGDGVFQVVSPSPYNRRITGRDPETRFTGPLADNPAYPGVGATAKGSLANCSGGITPWGTALSCEENYQDYASTAGFGYGWDPARVDTDDYYNGDGSSATVPSRGTNNTPTAGAPDTRRGPAKYGWVVETDPYDPSFVPRKHTALGRFRHENTAFRAVPGRRFVLYMGDDQNNAGVYKFVSDLPFRPGRRAENMRILESGTLYIARWAPEGRRRFEKAGDTTPLTPTSGTGTWREVTDDELVDTQRLIRAKVGTDAFNTSFATNRPEDIEVDEDGAVYIALTNNSTVNDSYGSIRRLREAGNDPTAESFTWEDYAAGGPSGRSGPGEEGFASPDNLVFDNAGHLWVVTDISSSALNKPGPNQFHANNAIFMIPRTGSNAGVAYRFGNMPIQAEGTGPYFTPDERTLFVNVQHPGEESDAPAGAGGNPDDNAANAEGLTSYWPRGNITTGQNPQKPLPSMVGITKLAAPGAGTPIIPPPPPGRNPDGTPAEDTGNPRIQILSAANQRLSALRSAGATIRLRVDEPGELRVTISGRFTSLRRRSAASAAARGRLQRLARRTVRVQKAGEVSIRLRPSAALRLRLRREKVLPAVLSIRFVDRAGNDATRTKTLRFK